MADTPDELHPRTNMSRSKRNLLICFDAFGTLFTPKRPVAQQYAEVASSLGPRKFTEDEVQKSFYVGKPKFSPSLGNEVY